MKTKSRLVKYGLAALGVSAAIASSSLLIASKWPSNFTAHEWGTFTSVQGGDGVLLTWNPLEASLLPKFVYDWSKPGLDRNLSFKISLGKGTEALQRMETPVIYFYAKEEQSVDVTVDFPKGTITEWYPQATQIGPSTMPAKPAIEVLDRYAHKAGIKASFTFASIFGGNRDVKESRARWANIVVLPEKQPRNLENILLQDKSASHYFAARDTDANYLRVSSLVATNPAAEHEKFIFYRGVGNFDTTLRVQMDLNHSLTLGNLCDEPLQDLFVLQVQNQSACLIHINALAPREQRPILMASNAGLAPLKTVSKELKKKMVLALIAQGLYEREAVAMVETWKDSWFTEEGVRVLYMLPRSWTDRILPLKMDPAPRELVRVMVGRAEVIPPDVQRRLSDGLVKAKAGDEQARAEVMAEFKKLGRFAQPALRLATKGQSAEFNQSAWSLYQASLTRTPDKAL